MGPESVQHWFKNKFIFGFPFLLILEQFQLLFWGPEPSEMSQDGSRKLPKSAKIAKRCVFESMCLLLFLQQI
jgi:hypothetical protein